MLFDSVNNKYQTATTKLKYWLRHVLAFYQISLLFDYDFLQL